jgi:hypothetical protein
MEIEEMFSNPAGWILAGVGEAALLGFFMLSKAMGNGDLIPFWTKIAALIVVPIIGFIWGSFMQD